MSRATLSDLSPALQAQVIAQIHRTPADKAPGIAQEPARKRIRQSVETPDASAFFVAAGLPRPVREYRFHPDRKWRYDFAWPEKRVALEIEGGAWTNGRHTRGKGFLGDMEKYNAAVMLGWRVFRCQPDSMPGIVSFLRASIL